MRALCTGTALAFLLPSAQAATDEIAIPDPLPITVKRADFGREPASRDARHIADWVVDSRDNLDKVFVIIDKIEARVFVFDADGRIRGSAPALLGSARGDHTVPGIGERKLSAVRPEERTTPAGRFVAAIGQSSRGEDVVWVDYDAAVSLHRVIRTQNRLQRLSTPTAKDKRVSFGCINVPTAFYNTVVSPAFSGTEGIVYVLPEIRSVREVFGSYDVDERSTRSDAALSASARNEPAASSGAR